MTSEAEAVGPETADGPGKIRSIAFGDGIETFREDLFRTLAEQSPNMIFLNEGGKVVYANAKCEEVMGYTREEFYSKDFDFFTLIAPESKELVADSYASHMRGEQMCSYEYRLLTKDGRTIDALMSSRLVDRGGERAILGTVTDISERKSAERELEKHRGRLGELVRARTSELTGANTRLQEEVGERKRAEEALRESEEKWRSLAENAPNIIVTAARDGTIQYVNRTVSGLSVDQTIGRKIYDYVDPEHHDVVRDVVETVFETGQVGSYVIKAAGPEGSGSWYETQAGPVKRDGRVLAAMFITTDVTERKRAEEALRESEDLHKTVVNALPEAVTMSNLDGRITYASRRTLEVHGYESAEDLIGEAAFELIAPEDRERAMTNLRRTLEEGLVRNLEYTLLREDGSRFPAELSAAVVPDASGEPKAFVAITRDITERKRAEEALRASEGQRTELALELAELRSEVGERYGFDRITGRDSKMRAIYDTILAVSRTLATVLIQGETGTGKELVAKAVHYNSPRRDRPFVKVDCGALAENLLESELFGHVKGAFTGAVRDRAGRFELADGATIFLDEIHNLSIPLQAKLLRVVQEGCFEKVGGTKTLEVDVRIVAATNEDLGKLVEHDRFRKDLYYRLNVIPILVPPLRERRGDVPLLMETFIKQFAERHTSEVSGISREAVDRLVAYDWPGNVRELENIIEQSVVLCQGRTIQAADVRLPAQASAVGEAPGAYAGPKPLKQALKDPEKRILLDALARANGNKKRAAGLLGISRSALYEKLRKHGIRTRTPPNVRTRRAAGRS
jgi:PAS domain S-box-containing protein